MGSTWEGAGRRGQQPDRPEAVVGRRGGDDRVVTSERTRGTSSQPTLPPHSSLIPITPTFAFLVLPFYPFPVLTANDGSRPVSSPPVISHLFHRALFIYYEKRGGFRELQFLKLGVKRKYLCEKRIIHRIEINGKRKIVIL